VSYHHPSGAVDRAAQVKQQQQQQHQQQQIMRSETPPTALSRPASSRSYHQVHPQVESPNQPHPPSLPPRNQPHPPPLPPPNQPHPPPSDGQRPPSLEQAPPDWKPEEPRGVALGGNANLAAMIAAKAASRKPMATSPTKKDQTDHPMVSQHQQQAANRNLFQEQQPHVHQVSLSLLPYLDIYSIAVFSLLVNGASKCN